MSETDTPEPLSPEAALEAHLAPAALPAWFDETKHQAGLGGIVEISTGILLDGEDGLPMNGALRAERLAAEHQPTRKSRRAAAGTEE